MSSDIACEHCGLSIDSERFLEIQPCTFIYDGREMARENIAYFVHMDCAEAFVSDMGTDR
jgi:hypothetical protein